MNKNVSISQALVPLRGDADAMTRRRAVVAVVAAGGVASQAELVERLEARGVHCTQATLSRDLKALRIGKMPTPGGGYVYTLPAPAPEVLDHSQAQWQLDAFVREVRLVGNLALVLTPPGNAQGVGRVLDQAGWEEVEGTISGDDTILVVTASAEAARAFQLRVAQLVGRKV